MPQYREWMAQVTTGATGHGVSEIGVSYRDRPDTTSLIRENT